MFAGRTDGSIVTALAEYDFFTVKAIIYRHFISYLFPFIIAMGYGQVSLLIDISKTCNLKIHEASSYMVKICVNFRPTSLIPQVMQDLGT